MFSIHPFPGTPPDPLEGIFMLDEETVSAMGDDRIPFQQGLWDGEKPDFGIPVLKMSDALGIPYPLFAGISRKKEFET